MPTLLTERLRIIAAMLVASAGMFLSSKASVLMYFFGLVNWSGVAVLLVPRPYRLRFVGALLAVVPMTIVVRYIADWLGQ